MGSPTPPALPEADAIRLLRDLADQSSFTKAYELLQTFSDPETWVDSQAIWEAARVLHHVGAPRRDSRLLLCAYRRRPKDPVLRTAYVHEVLEHRGPWFAWCAFRASTIPDDAPARFRALYWNLGGHIAALFRDLASAGAFLDRAAETGEERVRTSVARAFLLEQEERVDEALAAAQSVLAEAPRNMHAIEMVARLLHTLDRSEESLDLLKRADDELDSARISSSLAAVAIDLGRYRIAQQALERARARQPAIEGERLASLQAMLADCAYNLGDRARFVELARASKHPPLVRVAERVEQLSGNPKSVRLEVPFVRQHHATCAPATLAAIGQFWKRDIEHVEVADAICYDGTKPNLDRAWAKGHGWVARELTLDWETTVALLDAGLPVAVVSVDGLQAHMQAVVGYDARRKSMLLRDPSISIYVEVDAEAFFEHQAPFGPRGLLMVPPEKAGALEGIELPDEALHDELSGLHAALSSHERTRAVEHVDKLRESAPDHRITLFAERALAMYDGDAAAVWSVCERLVQAHANDWGAHAQALQAMTLLEPRRQRLERIEALLARADLHPSMLELAAAELTLDARDHVRASRLLRRMLRAAPLHAGALNLLGRIAWSAQQFDTAFEVFEFAAWLAPTDDAKAMHVHLAAMGLGRTEEGLTFLRGRAERYRKRSAEPTKTLFEALERLDRVDEAFDALDTAIEARPTDGDLLLFAARVHARYHHETRAQELFERASGRCSRLDELKALAEAAESDGHPADALGRWKRVVEHDPLGHDGHVAMARLLMSTEGAEAARAHLESAVETHPFRQDLVRLLVQVLRGADPDRTRSALDKHLEHAPHAAWAWRELAELHARGGDIDAARSALDKAAETETEFGDLLLTRAFVELRAGRNDEARRCLLEVIASNPDNPAAIATLADLASDADELRTTLDTVSNAIRSRSVDGNGIPAWYAALRSGATPAECARSVDQMRRQRPDLWTAWSVAIRNVCAIGKRKTALALVREARSRFPTVARLALDAVFVHRARNLPDRVLRSMKAAYRLSPEPETAAALCHAHLDADETEEARALLDRAIGRHPLHAELALLRSWMMWTNGEHEDAIASVEAVLERQPEHSGAWSLLAQRQAALGRPDEALVFAEKLAEERSWDAELMVRIAELRAEKGDLDGALESSERASALDGHLVDALDMRARILAAMGHESEALAVCAMADALPRGMSLPLRGRAAWIHHVFGNDDEAIARMSDVVRECPVFVWGIRNLIEWLVARKDHDGAESQAKRLTRIAPLEAEAFVVLGEAQTAAGRTAEARKSFERASDLDPGYVRALTSLIRSYLAEDEFDPVEPLIDRLENIDKALAAYWRTRTVIARRDGEALEGALRAMLEALASEALVRDAAESAARRIPSTLRAPLLTLALDFPDADYLGEMWAGAACFFRPAPSFAELRRLLKHAPRSGGRAVGMVFESFGNDGKQLQAMWLAALLWPLPWKHDLCWGQFGFMLLQSFLLQPLSLFWYRGFERREELRPWMLLNYAVALRRVYAYERAREIHERALALPQDHTVTDHKLWLALQEAIDGDAERSKDLLRVLPAEPNTLQQGLQFATEAVLVARGVEGHPPEERWLMAKIRLGRMPVSSPPDPVLQRLARRATRAMARHAGNRLAWSIATAQAGFTEAVRWIWPWLVLAIVVRAIAWIFGA
jgi:tetratricopeptide (TPR) repeat protein